VGLINDDGWEDFQAKQARATKLAAFLDKTRLSSELLEKIERARQDRMESQRISNSSADDDGGEIDTSTNGNTGTFPSAIGSSLGQLLKRPEIVIEDLAPVVREGYPEFFAEIGSENLPRRSEDAEEIIHRHNLDSGVGVPKLSAAARNEMKTVETEIKYAGYLDQQKKSIERLKKAEQREIPDWFDYGKVSGLSREMNEKLQRVRPRTLGQASRIPGVTPAAVSLINVYIEIQGRTMSRV